MTRRVCMTAESSLEFAQSCLIFYSTVSSCKKSSLLPMASSWAWAWAYPSWIYWATAHDNLWALSFLEVKFVRACLGWMRRDCRCHLKTPRIYFNMCENSIAANASWSMLSNKRIKISYSMATRQSSNHDGKSIASQTWSLRLFQQVLNVDCKRMRQSFPLSSYSLIQIEVGCAIILTIKGLLVMGNWIYCSFFCCWFLASK